MKPSVIKAYRDIRDINEVDVLRSVLLNLLILSDPYSRISFRSLDQAQASIDFRAVSRRKS